MPTTISGNLKNLATGAVTSSSNAFVRFVLRGTRGNQPRVTGTGSIAPLMSANGIFFTDIAADGSGNVSGTIYSTRDVAGTGNGDIEVGGSLTAVWYGMIVYNNGVAGPEVPVHAKNTATLDVSSVTAISTPAVSTAGTGDTTYLRLDGGNSPVTGLVQFTAGLQAKSVNTVRYADQYAGADASAKIIAAIADLPAGGGTVDCRGLSGNQTISQTITITSKVNLILPVGAVWTVTITNSTPAIWLKSDCAAMSFGHGVNNCYIALGSSAHVSEVLKVGGIVGATHVKVQGIHIAGNTSATVDNALVNIPGLFDSQFWNLSISALNGKGLWIHDNGAGNNTEQLDFYSLLIDGGHQAGSRPLVIESNAAAQVFGVSFVGGDLGHPGSGQSVVEINGHGRDANGFATFTNCYMESNSSDTTTAIVKIIDASQVVFLNSYFLRMSGSSTAYGIDISETSANLTYSIGAFCSRVTGGTGNHFINNHIDSDATIANANDAGMYFFLNSERSGTNHLWRVGGLSLPSDKTASFDKTVALKGSTSGSTVLQAAATASGTLTLPAATDTLVGKATTDTLTNKTFDTAGTGNVFKINGTSITDKNGTGKAVLDTAPTIAQPQVSGAAPTAAASQLGLGATTATSATAGANGAVPAQVVGYLIFNLAGTTIKIPYFNN